MKTKKMSDYELGERLDCLIHLASRLHDYSHVFGDDDKLVKMIDKLIDEHNDEIERREEEL